MKELNGTGYFVKRNEGPELYLEDKILIARPEGIHNFYKRRRELDIESIDKNKFFGIKKHYSKPYELIIPKNQRFKEDYYEERNFSDWNGIGGLITVDKKNKAIYIHEGTYGYFDDNIHKSEYTQPVFTTEIDEKVLQSLVKKLSDDFKDYSINFVSIPLLLDDIQKIIPLSNFAIYEKPPIDPDVGIWKTEGLLFTDKDKPVFSENGRYKFGFRGSFFRKHRDISGGIFFPTFISGIWMKSLEDTLKYGPVESYFATDIHSWFHLRSGFVLSQHSIDDSLLGEYLTKCDDHAWQFGEGKEKSSQAKKEIERYHKQLMELANVFSKAEIPLYKFDSQQNMKKTVEGIPYVIFRKIYRFLQDESKVLLTLPVRKTMEIHTPFFDGLYKRILQKRDKVVNDGDIPKEKETLMREIRGKYNV